jgi:hypothetical protein
MCKNIILAAMFSAKIWVRNMTFFFMCLEVLVTTRPPWVCLLWICKNTVVAMRCRYMRHVKSLKFVFMSMEWDCLWTAAINWLIVHPPGIWVWSYGRMILTEEDGRIRRKTCPSATLLLCSLQSPHGLTCVRIQASVVRGQQLITWAMAWPNICNLCLIGQW